MFAPVIHGWSAEAFISNGAGLVKLIPALLIGARPSWPREMLTSTNGGVASRGAPDATSTKILTAICRPFGPLRSKRQLLYPTAMIAESAVTSMVPGVTAELCVTDK